MNFRRPPSSLFAAKTRVSESSASGERVENDRVLIGTDLEDSSHEADWLWRDENVVGALEFDDRDQFLLRLLGVADLMIEPECLRGYTLFDL